jgi:hypothetical protein
MKNLKPMHIKVLTTIADYPQGLLLSQIQAFVGIKSKQLTQYYLNFLVNKKSIEKRASLYFALPHAGSAIPFTQPTQRPHAIRASAKLFRTSADRAEATLTKLNIPYKKVLRGSGMVFEWRELKLTLFKNGRLEYHPQLPEYPLNVPLQPIKAKAAHEAGVVFEALLGATGLRGLRDRTGRLAIEITYWENGYPKNEVATNTTEQGEKVVYAYDRETGKEAIWADNSLNPFTELETNKGVADKEIKMMMQGIADGELKPYEDEISTRRELAEIREIQLTQAYDMAKYAHNEIVHLDLLNKIRAENNKIRDMLSQRKLL